MLNDRWRLCLVGAFVLTLTLVVSACDTGPETKSSDTSEEAPEAERVSVPPEIEPGTETKPMPAFHEIPAGPERKQA